MPVKVFVLGRPGSGKSSTARRIVKLARRRDCSAIRVNDYDILQEMFKADSTHNKFRFTEYNGFDVLDFSILDTALKETEKRARKQFRSADIIVIEFARDNYGEALKQFSRAFLQDAFFLFLDTDTKTCIQRIHNRVANPSTLDDHFVSEKILSYYYHTQEMPSNLVEEYGVKKERIKVINNRGSREKFDKKINDLVNSIFEEDYFLAHRGVLWSLIENCSQAVKAYKETFVSLSLMLQKSKQILYKG